MPRLPIRPNLDQLRRQAKELKRAQNVKLADAQHALAQSYGLASWPRLVQACELVDAIWRDDLDAVLQLVRKHPRLLGENARGDAQSNWGPPMSYAANLGRTRIVEALQALGAADLEHAFDRACLQGRIETARKLHALGARPKDTALLGPCETLNAEGIRFLVEEMGAKLRLEHVALLLQTYSRGPREKHACLELVERYGIALPDTPAMAVHRGRVPARTADLSLEDVYPPSLGCKRELGLHGTPLQGATVLHMCVDFDELEVATALLQRGFDVNTAALTDRDGFGGHTALFACVVSQAWRCGLQRDGAFVKLLLDAGARSDVRASLRKQLLFTGDDKTYEYRDVTAREWGEQFHGREWVSDVALAALSGTRSTE